MLLQCLVLQQHSLDIWYDFQALCQMDCSALSNIIFWIAFSNITRTFSKFLSFYYYYSPIRSLCRPYHALQLGSLEYVSLLSFKLSLNKGIIILPLLNIINSNIHPDLRISWFLGCSKSFNLSVCTQYFAIKDWIEFPLKYTHSHWWREQVLAKVWIYAWIKIVVETKRRLQFENILFDFSSNTTGITKQVLTLWFPGRAVKLQSV